MIEDKSIEIFKAKDGVRVAEIDEDENGKYLLWEVSRINASSPGNRHSLLGDYSDLEEARAEAKMVVERYEQDNELK